MIPNKVENEHAPRYEHSHMYKEICTGMLDLVLQWNNWKKHKWPSMEERMRYEMPNSS